MSLDKAIKYCEGKSIARRWQVIKEIMDIKSPSKCATCKHFGDRDYCSNCHSDHSLFEEIDMRKVEAFKQGLDKAEEQAKQMLGKE